MHSLSPAYEDLDLDLRLRLDKVIYEFDVAFVADPGTRLEAFLAAAQAPRERAVLLLELLRVELECRRQFGQVPAVEEYLLRLPGDADTIRSAFRVSVDRMAGTRLGQYQLTRVVGRGAMGVVYAATDTVVNREVAVKILSESLETNAQAREYLLREAQLVGQLLHPNIVTLFEAREVDGVCFLALELVSGGSAAAALRHNGPFDWVVVSRIILDVCQGLAAAHAVGLIHRDIKPANILLLNLESASSTSSRSKLPVAKLTDFGLSRTSGDEARVGTPKYMAPEQFAHGISNPTTDIYSLGATYFTLLTGSPPFETGTLAELQEAHRTAPVPDVRKANRAAPEECARIVRRCLAKAPEERYPTVERLIADLDSLLASVAVPRRSRRRYWVLALAGAAALGAAGIVAFRSGAPDPGPTDQGTRAGPWEQPFDDRVITDGQVRQLIDRLGDGRRVQRESARAELLAIGEPALAALRNAVENTQDLEVRTSITELIDEIEKKASGLVRLFAGHRDRINGVSIDAEGKRALSASYDGTLRLWNLQTSDVVREIKIKNSRLTSAALSADGKRALAGAHESRMSLWDLEKGEIIRAFEGHRGAVWDVVLSPDGKKALSGCSDGFTRLWDLESGKELLTMRTQENGRAWTAAFTLDGKYAVAGGGNLMVHKPPIVGTLILWDLETGQEVRQYIGHTADVRRVVVSPDGKRILSGSFDGTMRLWEIGTGKEIKVFEGVDQLVVEAVVFTADGRRAVCSYGSRVLDSGRLDEAVRGSLRMWDLESGKEVKVFQGHTAPILSLASSANGRFLVSGSIDRTMRLWRVPN